MKLQGCNIFSNILTILSAWNLAVLRVVFKCIRLQFYGIRELLITQIRSFWFLVTAES
jgi:hypothetical protein